MPNHIHLIAVPETKDGLNLAIGEAHRRSKRRMARSFMAGKVRIIYHGRKLLAGMHAVY